MPLGYYKKTGLPFKPFCPPEKRKLFEKGNKFWELSGAVGRIPWNKGKHLSDAIKEKMSIVNKGKKPYIMTSEIREKIRLAGIGKKQSIETRTKRSEALRGSKCYAWKGGITPVNILIRMSLKYRLWRESVFKRDNYTCVWCGDNKGGNLNADHIKPFALFPELRFDITNGQTLCETCHKTKSSFDCLCIGGKISELNLAI